MPAETSSIYRFGVFELDSRAGELHKSGVKLKLQDQPYQLLLKLLEHSGEIVSREELRTTLWHEHTFVDFETGLNTAIKRLRETLGDSADNPKFIETVPRRGYRFVAPVVPHAQSASAPVVSSAVRWSIIVVVVGVVAVASTGYFYFHRPRKLSDKDTIVLADFTNATGDAVFDDTLRQGLSVQLEQSPFLSIVPEQAIQQTLHMMGQPATVRLTPELAREVCQRTESKAVIEGSIAQIGTQYSLILKAVNCQNGESLSSTETEASDKNHVLDALGKASSEIRSKLGESLRTVQKFDRPLQQSTTSSLEALQAYTLGIKMLDSDSAAAVSFFQQAIRMDSNFARAYLALGISYGNLGETNLMVENIRIAYGLRDRVSEREKIAIDGYYNYAVTGELEKALRVYELMAQLYPRESGPHNMMGGIYGQLGQPEKALEQFREAHSLEESSALLSDNLVLAYVWLNRIKEALATAKEAQGKHFYISDSLYLLGFWQSDAALMKQQVAQSAGKPGVGDQFLGFEADTAAYGGQLGEARKFSDRAVASAGLAGQRETAANYEAAAAVREALFGNAASARQRSAAALALSTGTFVQYAAGQALALAGDAPWAESLADDLARRFPEGAVVRFNVLPTLHAQIALMRNDASKAITVLKDAGPYELGTTGFSLLPVFVRGQAFLAAHQGGEAVTEFQKILDHRGIVLNSPIGALAHLQIARAYAMQGDIPKAKAAYQDFLTLWKDADPDIPIFIAAKAEYAKLQ